MQRLHEATPPTQLSFQATVQAMTSFSTSKIRKCHSKGNACSSYVAMKRLAIIHSLILFCSLVPLPVMNEQLCSQSSLLSEIFDSIVVLWIFFFFDLR